MKIKPVAFDSLGVRSMATLVETEDVRIFIDPGVALGPRRYGLPPHPKEYEKLEELARRVEKMAYSADIIVVTHYHYDHHDPGRRISTDIYLDKDVYLKHPERNINYSQSHRRAPIFLKAIEGKPHRIEYADGRSFEYGNTKIVFSKPVPHGPTIDLGYVLMVAIYAEGEIFLYTSDVEGPTCSTQVEFIIENRPDIIFLDGPVTYLLGHKFTAEELEVSISYLKKILYETPVRWLIVDHHFTRDIRYRERLEDVVNYGRRMGVRVITAAEFGGMKVNTLEAWREQLYQGDSKYEKRS